MKSDAVIRVPRETWAKVRAYALNAGRDMREVTAAALEAYLRG